VAKYLLRPAFGINYEPVFMNLDKWNQLSKEDQELLLKVARQVEESWYRDAPKVWEAEEKELLKRGMQVTTMGEQQKAVLHQAWAEGLWGEGMKKSPRDVQALRDFARSKGLAE